MSDSADSRWSGRPLPAASQCAKDGTVSDRDPERSDHHREETSTWKRLASSESIWQKRSFQVHGARADGSVACRGKLSRRKLLSFLASQPGCTVAMETAAAHADDQRASGPPGRAWRRRSAGESPDRAAGRGSRRRGLWPAGGGRRAWQAAARADRRARPEDRRTRQRRSRCRVSGCTPQAAGRTRGSDRRGGAIVRGRPSDRVRHELRRCASGCTQGDASVAASRSQPDSGQLPPGASRRRTARAERRRAGCGRTGVRGLGSRAQIVQPRLNLRDFLS